VEIKPAKGRPMLTWVGKRPLRQVTAFPAQLIETFSPNHGQTSGSGGAAVPGGAGVPACHQPWGNWPAAYPRGGLLFHGDNKEVLAHLLANGFRGRVKLIYIDPPFDSGANYVRKVTLRGAKGTAKIEGEGYTLGEQIQYTDIWANDNYLQFMYERLLLLKELMTLDGSIFIHLDSSRGHYVKILMDEVFGVDNFRSELVVKRRITKNLQQQFAGIKSYPQAHDVVLWYTMDPNVRYKPAETKVARREGGYWHHFWSGEDRPTMRYPLLGVTPKYGQWKWSKERADKAVANYEKYLSEGTGKTLEQYWEENGSELEFIRKSKKGVIENWFPPKDTRIADTLWLDIHAYENEKDFPTQKHEQLINRLVSFASLPSDLILDFFIGSGTTAAVAQKLGRRWMGCDINKGAIQTTCKRLQTIILEQMEAVRKGKQLPLPPAGEGAQDNGDPPPAQLSFSVYRVNDYDLAIQHNEAVNLACEHIGITRTRTDAFFDGALGKKLVKIVPFGHPLTLLDLEEIKRELSARPEEERDICVVCLGKETAADGWLEDWNRLRKQGDVPNKIEVIELRTDPRYGKFFVHQPATARVSITRDQGKIRVEIQDFISPTIIERLKQQSGLLTPQIDDWRAMVDSVMIDLAYNGEVFNVAFADVPPKKSDLVAGQYDLDALEGETTVAVKITDMLGEEVLVTQRI
jgi:DNA modification methylase